MNARFTPPADNAAEPPAQVPKHEAFSWLARPLEGKPHAEFGALTMDVCRGAGLCLELVQMAALDRLTDAGSAYLRETETERLMALAMRSIQMLGDRAEADIFEMNEAALRATMGGAK